MIQLEVLFVFTSFLIKIHCLASVPTCPARAQASISILSTQFKHHLLSHSCTFRWALWPVGLCLFLQYQPRQYHLYADELEVGLVIVWFLQIVCVSGCFMGIILQWSSTIKIKSLVLYLGYIHVHLVCWCKPRACTFFHRDLVNK